MVGLVVVPLDGSIWEYMRKKAKRDRNCEAHPSLTIYTVLVCWLSFSNEWVMTLLTHDNDVTFDLSLSVVVIVIGKLPF